MQQVDSLLHRHANLIVHHSFVSLGGAYVSPDSEQVIYDVGPSPRFVPHALFLAFFSYAHLTSVVLNGDEQTQLAALWREHRGAFTVIREAPGTNSQGEST